MVDVLETNVIWNIQTVQVLLSHNYIVYLKVSNKTSQSLSQNTKLGVSN